MDESTQLEALPPWTQGGHQGWKQSVGSAGQAPERKLFRVLEKMPSWVFVASECPAQSH